MHPARSPGNVRSVSDPAFPSGQWIGFYTYANQTKRYLVDLILEFRDGMISGEGADGIGFLGIDGRYYSKEAECSRIKTYFGEMNVEDLKCNKCQLRPVCQSRHAAGILHLPVEGAIWMRLKFL